MSKGNQTLRVKLLSEEIVQKARAEQAAKREKAGIKQEEEQPPPKLKKSSYFDDAGDEKYRRMVQGASSLSCLS